MKNALESPRAIGNRIQLLHQRPEITSKERIEAVEISKKPYTPPHGHGMSARVWNTCPHNKWPVPVSLAHLDIKTTLYCMYAQSANVYFGKNYLHIKQCLEYWVESRSPIGFCIDIRQRCVWIGSLRGAKWSVELTPPDPLQSLWKFSSRLLVAASRKCWSMKNSHF